MIVNSGDGKKRGHIFNIQRYSVHDGPGIRTLVFLKGCPLRCRWCSNPESQTPEPELAFNQSKCIGALECARCIGACRHGALREGADGKITVDRALCVNCLDCVDACPSRALNSFGQLMTVEEVLKAVEADGIFYARSGGGVTLSGGEPLMQTEFTVELLKEAKRRRMNTTMETCGFSDWDSMEKACALLDAILFDIKCLDPVKHKEYTGVDCAAIQENFEKVCARFPSLPKLVRTPVIPGFNDSEQDIAAILDCIGDKPNVKYELLPYHRLGQPKYQYLGREYPMGDVRLENEKIELLKDLVKSRLVKS